MCWWQILHLNALCGCRSCTDSLMLKMVMETLNNLHRFCTSSFSCIFLKFLEKPPKHRWPISVPVRMSRHWFVSGILVGHQIWATCGLWFPPFTIRQSADRHTFLWLNCCFGGVPALRENPVFVAFYLPVFHPVECSYCRSESMMGFRYRCQQCHGYQLCQSCFWRGHANGPHSNQHQMKEHSSWVRSDHFYFFYFLYNSIDLSRCHQSYSFSIDWTGRGLAEAWCFCLPYLFWLLTFNGGRLYEPATGSWHPSMFMCVKAAAALQVSSGRAVCATTPKLRQRYGSLIRTFDHVNTLPTQLCKRLLEAA